MASLWSTAKNCMNEGLEAIQGLFVFGKTTTKVANSAMRTIEVVMDANEQEVKLFKELRVNIIKQVKDKSIDYSTAMVEINKLNEMIKLLEQVDNDEFVPATSQPQTASQSKSKTK